MRARIRARRWASIMRRRSRRSRLPLPSASGQSDVNQGCVVSVCGVRVCAHPPLYLVCFHSLHPFFQCPPSFSTSALHILLHLHAPHTFHTSILHPHSHRPCNLCSPPPFSTSALHLHSPPQLPASILHLRSPPPSLSLPFPLPLSLPSYLPFSLSRSLHLALSASLCTWLSTSFCYLCSTSLYLCSTSLFLCPASAHPLLLLKPICPALSAPCAPLSATPWAPTYSGLASPSSPRSTCDRRNVFQRRYRSQSSGEWSKPEITLPMFEPMLLSSFSYLRPSPPWLSSMLRCLFL